MKNEIILAIIKKLIEEKMGEITASVGRRGLKGADGRDFDFEENREKISEIIKSHLESLSLEKKEKEFNWDDIKDDVTHVIAEVIRVSREDLKLKFSDLEIYEVELLKGEDGKDGRPGRDGKDFEFEEYRHSISDIIHAYIDDISSGFVLKFSDLSESEKDEIRLKFSDLTRQEKLELKLKFSDLSPNDKDELRLKFEQLTDEEKDELKLKFEDLTPEEVLQLRGPRGQRGKQGDVGLRGSKWHIGQGEPSDMNDLIEGDMYLDVTSGDVYEYMG